MPATIMSRRLNGLPYDYRAGNVRHVHTFEIPGKCRHRFQRLKGAIFYFFRQSAQTRFPARRKIRKWTLQRDGWL